MSLRVYFLEFGEFLSKRFLNFKTYWNSWMLLYTTTFINFTNFGKTKETF